MVQKLQIKLQIRENLDTYPEFGLDIKVEDFPLSDDGKLDVNNRYM